MSKPVAKTTAQGFPTPLANGSPGGPPHTPARPPPVIPDHELLRPIGRGAYGEVWLARNVVGTLRAVKVLYRQDFGDAHPFDREFHGIQNFEPISRSHPGVVNILQIGRNDAEGYFYYARGGRAELERVLAAFRQPTPVSLQAEQPLPPNLPVQTTKARLAYTMPETAELLGVSYQTTYRLVKRGLLMPSYGVLRTKVIARAEIERCLQDSRCSDY